MKPIIFSTEMVQAILAGLKTQTRRVIKGVSTEWDCFGRCTDGDSLLIGFGRGERLEKKIKAPYQPGDILWVRETWAETATADYVYIADFPHTKALLKHGKWRPSIHMPKKAARIFLRVTDVRVERVQDITEEGAWKEGCPDDAVPDKYPSSVAWFHELWDRLNLKRGYGWGANPYVWVIEFERVGKDELKPCPFCGEKVKLWELSRKDQEAELNFIVNGIPESVVFHFILCEACAAQTGNHDSPEQAAEAWNRRAE